MDLATIFKSFKSRNYRLFFLGQSVSLVGTWMQRMAVSWLVYRVSHSALMLGVVTFAASVPTFLLSPYGGIISDKYNRYKILLVTQVASMIQAIILAALVLLHVDNVAWIAILSGILGAINAFDTPARQSLVIDMVDDKNDLPNAIALSSSMVNLARLIGPTVAGIVLTAFGEGVCFMLNALSFIAVIASLLLMHLPAREMVAKNKNNWRNFKEGFVYLRRSPELRNVIFMMALISFFVMPFSTLLPIFAKDIFKGDAATFGWLNSATGLGALIGALYLASLRAGGDLNKVLLAVSMIFASGLALFAYTTNLPLALLFSFILGFGMMAQITLSNSIVQQTVSDEMRGRIISFFVMAFLGMQPFGSLLVGAMAHVVGAQATLLAEGIIGLAIAFWFMPFFRNNRFQAMKTEMKAAQLKGN